MPAGTRAQALHTRATASGVAPASPQAAYRALLERAGSREPADRGGVDGIGPRHIGHCLARVKALQRFLTLVRSHLAGTTELDATGLRTGTALARPRTDQLALELGKAAEHRDQPTVRARGVRPGVLEAPAGQGQGSPSAAAR